jgi:zinc transporter ZupT
MYLIFGFATMLATGLGGLFALKRQDKLHLILGFSAGAVIGVAFFDLLPEAISLSAGTYPVSTVTTVIAVGFLLFMLLNRIVVMHPHADEEGNDGTDLRGPLGAGSLSIHSFLDGLGIGLAFQVSSSVGLIVASAVLAHDFSDGINTVGMILRHNGDTKHAFRWLAADALAPMAGIIATRFFSLPEPELGILLALFCGFFLYIGASDLLPESHHSHPTFVTSLMTVLGSGLIYLVIRIAQ